MRLLQAGPWRALLVATLFAAVDAAIAQGQDNLAQVEGAVVVEQAADNVVIFNNGFVVNNVQSLNVDQWVFGQQPTQGRRRLDTLLETTLDDVARDCEMTELQQKKLRTAGRGDIQRLYARVEELKAEIASASTGNEQNRLNEIVQECQKLQGQINADFYGQGSLFAKTLRTALSKEQIAARDKAVGERQMFRYRARVELAVANLDDTIGLTDEQRRGLVRLVLEKTTPPLRFGQYDYQLVLIKMGRVPEDSLKSLLDAEQWEALQQSMRDAEGMKQYLEANGFLREEGGGASPAAGAAAAVIQQPFIGF